MQVFSPGNPNALAAGTAYAPLGTIHNILCTPATSPPVRPVGGGIAGVQVRIPVRGKHHIEQ